MEGKKQFQIEETNYFWNIIRIHLFLRRYEYTYYTFQHF